MTERPIIAGIGEILWDVFPERKVLEVAAYVCTQHGAMPELPLSLLKPVRH